jgi:hypothetical protein
VGKNDNQGRDDWDFNRVGDGFVMRSRDTTISVGSIQGNVVDFSASGIVVDGVPITDGQTVTDPDPDTSDFRHQWWAQA